MAKLGYIRVSTQEQHTDRQEIALKSYDIEKYFIEKVSGKNTDREELKKMLEYMREGDTIYIESFSRLSRSLVDLLNLVNLMQEKGVKLVSLKENFDTSTPAGTLQLQIFGALYEFERTCMKERQREGIAARKAKGLPTGRPKAEMTKEFKVLAEKNLKGEITATACCKKLNMSRTTFYKLLKEYKKELSN